MHRFARALRFAIALGVSVPAAAVAQASGSSDTKSTSAATDKAIKAKQVSTRVVVHLHTGEKDGKHVRYTLDNEDNSVGHKADGAMFSTSSELLVTYPRMNPLTVQASASVSAVDDPAHAAIAQLIAALSGVPGLVNPDLAKAAALAAAPRASVTADPTGFALPKCQELQDAESVLAQIQAGLFGPTVSAATLASQFAGWVKRFDDQLQPFGATKAAVETADQIESFHDTVKRLGDQAAEAIKSAHERADDPPEATAAQRRYNEVLAEALSGRTQAEQIRALAARKQELEELNAAAAASRSCAQDALNLYRLITIANPQVRLGDVRKLEKTLLDLKNVMKKTYGDKNNWYNDIEYVLARDITVTTGKLARIAVKVATISVTASDASLNVLREDAASASFDIREHTTWVPELGVGATFAVVDRPKYGTTTNAEGKTVVSKATTESFGVSPTVMVNFVPTGLSGAVPIIQLGASTSTSTPALFIGPGWRLPGSTGRSGLVIGVGLVLGWVKDLETLVPETSVVTGTKDIEKDLKFDPKPRTGFYVNIQYKF